MNEPDNCFMYHALRAITLDTNDDIHHLFHTFIHSSLFELLLHSVYQWRFSQAFGKWTWSWNRTAGNLFLMHSKRKKKILPCVLSLSQSSSYFWTCMSHMSSMITRSGTRPHKTIMCYCSSFSFIIYSGKVPILPTLFSGQVKLWAAFWAMGLNGKWTFIARSCALFYSPSDLVFCAVPCDCLD